MNTSTVDEQTATTDIVVPQPNYADDTLRAIDSFSAAIDAAGYMFGEVDDASDVLGDGFRLLKEKDSKGRLVGKPMVLLEWTFYPSAEFGGEFASIRAVTQEEQGIGKYIVNDGSTGVCKTLREYTDRTGKRGGLLIRNGFRESTYPFCNDCRTAVEDAVAHKAMEPTHSLGIGRTYYIDTSA